MFKAKKFIPWTHRDRLVFDFLWKWKFATTAALAKKFFPEAGIETAYNRLNKLKGMGLIKWQFDKDHKHAVWALTEKSFKFVKDGLSIQPSGMGYLSENIPHDILVNAVHLGDWLCDAPPEVTFHSEQELRRIDEEFFEVDNLPRSNFVNFMHERKYHRPDGYWKITKGEKYWFIALEVERHLQRRSRYEIIGEYYAKSKTIFRVLWVVPRRAAALKLYERIKGWYNKGECYHAVVLENDFLQNGWQAKIFIGADQNKTILELLESELGRKAGESPCSNMHVSLLDSRKCPIKSKN